MSWISEVFSNSTYLSDCVALDTGNLFVAYEEEGDLNYGKFAIYTNELVAAYSGTFASLAPSPLAVTKLLNGNVVVAYGDWDTFNCNFVIYSPTGVVVKASTVFKANYALTRLGCCTLNNGNFVIVYDTTAPESLYFVIYDADGNLIKAETTITSDDVNTFAKVSTLVGGNFVVAYRNWEFLGEELQFAIYNQSGTVVKGPTIVDDVVLSAIPVPLSTGNFMLLWSSTGGLYYAIYEPGGGVVQAKTTLIGDHPTYGITAVKLSDNTIPIMFSTLADGLSIVIVDEGGGIVVPSESFESEYRTISGSSALIDDKVGVTSYSYGSGIGYVSILTIEASPVITYQPDSITVAKGQLASFSITAVGAPTPSYQWYKDDIELTGKTNSTLSFYADYGDAGTYKCRAYNVAGEVYSDPATLTVTTNPWRYNLFRLQSDIDRS